MLPQFKGHLTLELWEESGNSLLRLSVPWGFHLEDVHNKGRTKEPPAFFPHPFDLKLSQEAF